MVSAVSVQNVHKRYGANEVLKGVSLSAENGSVVTLIGSSGSGKSTMLRCINLLEIPDEGSIAIGGEPIAMKKDRRGRNVPANTNQVSSIRSRVGMVFQNFNLWSHMTVIENVIEGPVQVLGMRRAEATEMALALLAKVGIDNKRDAYPGHLSGGQQQRAAIARTLAMSPQVMLFDEPTSSLDPELVSGVLGVIRSLAEEGRTMLLVTHEMGFAREVSSEILFLHRGVVEEAGPPAQIFNAAKSERCRQFLSNQLK